MIANGTKLGRYEVRGLIGAGGMGEVYRAHDPNLVRDVAVKVLPKGLSDNADRLRRFEQEAQSAGTLNHPNILVIHEIGSHDGAPYIVSELLDGEPLADHIAGAALPQRKAINYAMQLARGLAAAHDKGIVHRDLKPDNIFVTKDGRLKILDFGLAKLVAAPNNDQPQTDVPTRKLNTDPGTVMGTMGYMSPEQLRGQPVDHRSDLFSFGAILYEMLAGRRAFSGGSAAETMSAILREDPPDLSTTNRNISPTLERIVAHCLEKNPDERFQSAQDLAFALDAVSSSSSSTAFAEQIESASSFKKTNREYFAWSTAAVLFLALLASLAFAYWYFRSVPEDTNTVRFAVQLPEGVTFGPDVETHNVSVSQDGTRLTFTASTEGQRMLWVRPLNSLSAEALPGTEGALSPFWSPDGRYLAFFAEGKLKKIEASGGSLQTLCNLGAEADAVGSWGSDGTILYAIEAGIYRVPAAGGTPTLLIGSTKDTIHYWVNFLPDGRKFLFVKMSEKGEGDGIYVGSTDSADMKLVVDEPSRAEYAAPGYLLYVRNSVLLAQEFDIDELALKGEPFVLVERLPYFDKTAWAEFTVSQSGILVHISNIWISRVLWVDRAGREVGQIGTSGEHYAQSLSPDGQKVAVATNDKETGSGDLWLHDVARNTQVRFTIGPTDDSDPVWSPDGRRLAFFSCCEAGKSSLRIKAVDEAPGTGESPFQSGFNSPYDWSSDGRFILYSENAPTTQRDIWVLPISGEQPPYAFLQTPFEERGARFSPNGRWVAFVSNESGRDEVYVSRFEKPGEKWRISNGGGRSPRWRRDGRELFYLAADRKIMAVPVSSTTVTFQAGDPVVLFKAASIIEDDYDVAADGQTFLVNSSVAGAQATPFTAVLNWTNVLKR